MELDLQSIRDPRDAYREVSSSKPSMHDPRRLLLVLAPHCNYMYLRKDLSETVPLHLRSTIVRLSPALNGVATSNPKGTLA